jgi:hypothetical protein
MPETMSGLDTVEAEAVGHSILLAEPLLSIFSAGSGWHKTRGCSKLI